ncbi:MAG: cytochrome c [Chloroflexi bacterium]|nr:MAG: cytochrome c [Chloroflexota bacterium]
MIRRDLVGVLLLFTLVLFGIGIQRVNAGPPAQDQEQDAVTRGAMLYDKWYAKLGQEAPGGNMPLWDQQTTNTRSGPDTWRCVSCHGWDYQGREGAYRYGSNYTGFPGVYQARGKGEEAVIAALQGAGNTRHDFSAYLDEKVLNDLATFITTAMIDDNEYIDPQTLAIKGGDSAHGKQLYEEACASCHGADGKKIVFRYEGRNAWLGTLATLDPWRYLHKTRFGTPGTEMPVGYALGWSPQDGRDVLLYTRSLPGGLEAQAQFSSLAGQESAGQPAGGPATSIFTGMLTALGSITVAVGFAVLIGAALFGIIFLLVWVFRGQQKH